MNIKNGITRKVNVKITVFDLEGNVKEEIETHNLMPTVGLEMWIDALMGDIADLELKYVAVGDDNTAPALTDTTLGNETFRKVITATSKLTDTSLLTTLYIAPDEAVGDIKEIGWFCGAAATITADTGILLGRVLYTRTKTNIESILIQRTDSIVEA